MSVETPSSGPRRSPLSPRPLVRIRALPNHEYGADVYCGSCHRYHPTELYIHAADACTRADFYPAGGAAFVSTSPDDSEHIATINRRLVPTGPSHADEYYHPRTIDPTDPL